MMTHACIFKIFRIANHKEGVYKEKKNDTQDEAPVCQNGDCLNDTTTVLHSSTVQHKKKAAVMSSTFEIE